MHRMLWKVFFTVAATATFGFVSFLLSPPVALVAADAAGRQFENSASSYVSSAYILGSVQAAPIALMVVLVFVIAAIWISPLRRLLAKGAPSIALAFSLLISGQAFAFFETTDKTEAYTILPNETGFFVPDVGANKDGQTQLDSEAYLLATRLP